ncbi:MAG: hypothetical protein AAF501_14605 [Pseudomonadota bacterium]
MVSIRNVLTGSRGNLALPAGARLSALNLTFTAESAAGPEALGQVQALAATGVVEVIAVGGLAGNVGQPLVGDAGGIFTVSSEGVVLFDPAGAFDALAAGQSATTSVSYTVTDGTSEDTGDLAVSVVGSAALLPPQATGTIPDQQDQIAV